MSWTPGFSVPTPSASDVDIPAPIARDTEVTAAVAAEAALARNADNLTSGTVADARIASTITRDAEAAAAYQPLDSDLTAIAALTTTATGRSLLAAADAAAIQAITLAAPASPAFWRMVDEDAVTVTSGDITLNATAITNLTATQVTLNGAAVGDVVYMNVEGLVTAVAQAVGFDGYTYPGGTRTNPFGAGLSASLASTQGSPALYQPAEAMARPVTASLRRVLVAGDIASGNVIVGLAYAKLNTTARVLSAVANIPLKVSAQLWRAPA